ncbi:Copper transporter 5 [Camellia lanceoleosa]|uniref:Copper transporter 5 n=1 Tax=Camellia lanceoleosa TaxID=1840588 RepID=A0ACC0IPY3_9ERIC|nr:Copper transporter 5 [Camellia lanceoleosa]
MLVLDSWKTETWTKYALTLCACLLFYVFYQYLEDLRLRFKLILTSNKKTFPLSSSSIIDDHHTPLIYHKLLTSSSAGH